MACPFSAPLPHPSSPSLPPFAFVCKHACVCVHACTHACVCVSVCAARALVRGCLSARVPSSIVEEQLFKQQFDVVSAPPATRAGLKSRPGFCRSQVHGFLPPCLLAAPCAYPKEATLSSQHVLPARHPQPVGGCLSPHLHVRGVPVHVSQLTGTGSLPLGAPFSLPSPRLPLPSTFTPSANPPPFSLPLQVTNY